MDNTVTALQTLFQHTGWATYETQDVSVTWANKVWYCLRQFRLVFCHHLITRRIPTKINPILPPCGEAFAFCMLFFPGSLSFLLSFLSSSSSSKQTYPRRAVLQEVGAKLCDVSESFFKPTWEDAWQSPMAGCGQHHPPLYTHQGAHHSCFLCLPLPWRYLQAWMVKFWKLFWSGRASSTLHWLDYMAQHVLTCRWMGGECPT